jgi:hypothetical protein
MENNDVYQKYIKYKNKYYDLIKKRLQKSIGPHQVNDFFFLTIPKGHPDAGKEVPIDYKLRNIILYFWDKGLITLGSDQGGDFLDCFSAGFISFANKNINSNDTLDILKNLLVKKFGDNNIKVKNMNFTHRTEKEIIKKLSEHKQFLEKFFKKNPHKILLEFYPNFISMSFKSEMIYEIHNKLNIKFPDYNKRCPGYLIPYVIPK